MQNIHFLTTRQTRRAQAFAYPMHVFAKQLRRAGLNIHFFYDVDDTRLLQCDVLGVINDFFGIKHLLQHADDVVALLENWHQQVGKLVWCDLTDGTGTLFEPAARVVDIYLKKQLLVDRQLYRQTYHEREYYLDYYYKHHRNRLEGHGEIAQIVNQTGLDEESIARLTLGWNIGLGDYNTLLMGRGRKLHTYWWPMPRFKSITRPASAPRPIDLSLRAGTTYQFAAPSFHRREAKRLVAEIAQQQPGYTIQYEGKLPLSAYMQEIANSRIAPSPFGLGEICWRDFEIMLGGSLLFKPDMDHLETWPDFFEKDVTYVAHNWDFSDFQTKTLDLLQNPARCQQIAQAAQTRYQASLSGPAFIEHFQGIFAQ